MSEKLLFQEIQILKELDKRGAMPLRTVMEFGFLDAYDTEAAIRSTLKDYVQVKQDFGDEFASLVSLSYAGKSFLLYRRQRLLEIWIPFAVTTLISILALCLSVIALFAE